MSSSRPRGRPIDPAKRTAIVEAARMLFMREGPAGMTIEAVARHAGVSKVTVYAHFQDRDALIHAAIREQQQRLVVALRMPVDDTPGLRRSLLQFGRDVLDFICSDDYQLADRLVTAHVHREPTLGHWIYQNGAQAVVGELAALLDRFVERGLLEVDDSLLVAEQLIGMWMGVLREWLRMHPGSRPGADELEARVTRGVDTFIRAFAPR